MSEDRQQRLIDAVAKIISRQPQGISEYELIRLLQGKPYELLDGEALKDELTLFQCHFILFNACYQLRDLWLTEQIACLEIHSLCIEKKPYQPGSHELAHQDKLREYYLDWQNYSNTGRDDVQSLLESFWQRMVGQEQRVTYSSEELEKAYEVLDIPEQDELSIERLKRYYRRQQHLHHPDKGGELVRSQEIEWAYQLIKEKVRGC